MIARTARGIAGKLKGWSRQRCSRQLRGSEGKPEFPQRELQRLREQVKQRSQRIAELEREVEEQQKKLGEREKELADAEKKITDLERQLALRGRNSTTSSKPPSSDGLGGRDRPRGCRRKKRRRKAGGQKGHPGHGRPLVPPERVNQVVEVFPTHCQHCQRELPADAATRLRRGEPRRHQVTELPRIEAHITEYQMHNVVCEDCGATTQAPLPPGAQGQFGPQLTALMD